MIESGLSVGGHVMKAQRPDHYHSTNVIGLGNKSGQNCGNPEEIRVFDVVLEKPEQIFFSGNTINGQVKIDLDTCLTLQGIIVRFVGEAYVSVPEEGDGDRWGMRRHMQQLRPAFCTNKITPSLTDPAVGAACCVDLGTDSPAPDPTDWTPNGGSGDWAHSKPRPRNRTIERHLKIRATEVYFDNKVYVYGHKYSSRREQLWAGSHSFPFQYTLPSKLPSSFHGRHGYVRYYCEVTLQRALAPNVQRRVYFSVSNVADINTDSKAESSSGEQKSTNSCLFCCQKGTVMVSACIRRRGYVPGEEILVSADVLNMSNRVVRRSIATLRQVVTYISSKGTRRHVDEPGVCEVTRGAVPIGESDSWEEVSVPVPSLPPTSRYNNWCKLMEIDYRLDFAVDIDGEQAPLELRMPVIIGTVPLQREFKNMRRELGEAAENEAPRPNMQLANKYHKLPTAFSELCVWGERPVDTYYYRHVARPFDEATLNTNAKMNKEILFAPRYVCYRPQNPRMRLPLARTLPEIVISQPTGTIGNVRQHLHAASRRHSAPAHLVDTPKHETIPEVREDVLVEENEMEEDVITEIQDTVV